MSKGLEIAKHLSTKVTVKMADGQDIDGYFYLSEFAENHIGSETILDLLNSLEMDFIPFEHAADKALILLKKSQIVGILADASDIFDQAMKELVQEKSNFLKATIVFSQFSLEGNAFIGGLHPNNSRLIDLLNSEEPFFYFQAGEQKWVLCKENLKYIHPAGSEGNII